MERGFDADYALIYWLALTSQFVTALTQGIGEEFKSILGVAITTHFD